MRLASPPVAEAGQGVRGLGWLALALGPLLLAAWQLKPLYADNQNTKFLHALADTGAGYLREDWLAHTKDGLPLFTALLEGILRTVGPNGFYFAAALTYIVFLFCAIAIYQRLARHYAVPRHGLPVFLAMIFISAMLIDVQRIVYAGFSEQYILSGYFQSADFGVLLIAAVVLLEARRLSPAIACILVAAAMHPGYVAPGAVLLGIFLLYELMHPAEDQPGAKFVAVASSAMGFIVLFSIAFALKQLFAPTDAETQLEAHQILTAVRIPRHADPAVWFNQNVVLQFALCIGAAKLLPAGRLRFVMRLGLGALTALTFVAFLPHTETYRLVAPWRISVVLVPLATIALFAMAIVRMNEKGMFAPARLRTYIAAGVGAVLFCVAVGTTFTVYKIRKPEPAYLAFVRANLVSGQQYLTPPVLSKFRLATGAPQFVTFKSHPYQDVEVLDWNRRLKVANEIYEGTTIDCERLQRLVVEEAGDSHSADGGNPTMACGFASKIFEDGNTKIFSLSRTTLAEAGTRPMAGN